MCPELLPILKYAGKPPCPPGEAALEPPHRLNLPAILLLPILIICKASTVP